MELVAELIGQDSWAWKFHNDKAQVQRIWGKIVIRLAVPRRWTMVYLISYISKYDEKTKHRYVGLVLP